MIHVYPDGSIGDPESDREALKEAIKILVKEKIKENNMPTTKLEIELDEYKAFELLLEALHVDLNEDIKEDAFAVEDGEIVVKDYDDRGELYLALYHLATKIYPNTGFRNMFDDPRKLMTKLYEEMDKEEHEITEEEYNRLTNKKSKEIINCYEPAYFMDREAFKNTLSNK